MEIVVRATVLVLIEHSVTGVLTDRFTGRRIQICQAMGRTRCPIV
jgi:hypothetical protein